MRRSEQNAVDVEDAAVNVLDWSVRASVGSGRVYAGTSAAFINAPHTTRSGACECYAAAVLQGQARKLLRRRVLAEEPRLVASERPSFPIEAAVTAASSGTLRLANAERAAGCESGS